MKRNLTPFDLSTSVNRNVYRLISVLFYLIMAGLICFIFFGCSKAKITPPSQALSQPPSIGQVKIIGTPWCKAGDSIFIQVAMTDAQPGIQVVKYLQNATWSITESRNVNHPHGSWELDVADIWHSWPPDSIRIQIFINSNKTLDTVLNQNKSWFPTPCTIYF